MPNDILVVSVVTIRVLFLVVFLGGYLWLLSFLRTVPVLPPPQRLRLVSNVFGRFLLISWITFVVMSIGGILSAFYPTQGSPPQLSVNYILSSPDGLILGLEFILTLLMLTLNVWMQLLYSQRISKAGISVLESVDKTLKWLTAPDSSSGIKAINRLLYVCTSDVILGVFAIVLGVILSNP